MPLVLVCIAVLFVVANIVVSVGVACFPVGDQGPHLSNGRGPVGDQGPHLSNGWGQVVRHRHLYAARHGVHLQISGDGQVHGSPHQTQYSLLEIRSVDTGCVVIKGIATSQFLCMEGDGRLYSSHTYSRDDCTFREQIQADGYNVYVSDKHGTLLSLGNHRQRLQGRDRGLPALSQFLPRVGTAGDFGLAGGGGPELTDHHRPEQTPTQTPEQTMDTFGMLSQLIHSPSFNNR